MSVRFNLDANSSMELLEKLARLDITVSGMKDGRTTHRRERYMMARMLATLAPMDALEFPLRVEHREKPDFAVYGRTRAFGVECVQATHPEWKAIQAIRDRDFPDALISVPMLRPGHRSFSTKERVEIARGDRRGPPWVGSMPQKQWAEGLAHFIEEKTKKLRKGNYSDFTNTWLLVQDEWPAPVHDSDDYVEAASLCVNCISSCTLAPCFSRILVANHRWLISLFPGAPFVEPMNHLWQ